METTVHAKNVGLSMKKNLPVENNLKEKECSGNTSENEAGNAWVNNELDSENLACPKTSNTPNQTNKCTSKHKLNTSQKKTIKKKLNKRGKRKSAQHVASL